MDVARIHPFIEQIDGLAFTGALNPGDQYQHREAALLLEVKLRVKQRFPEFCLLALVNGLVDVMFELGGRVAG